MTLEEGVGAGRRPDIWAMAGEERQQQGRCVAGLVLSVGAADAVAAHCHVHACAACSFSRLGPAPPPPLPCLPIDELL